MKNSTPLPSLFASFKQAFYTPSFYKQVPSFSFGKVMAYLLVLSTVSYLLLLGQGANLVWQNRDEIKEMGEKILNSYPEELELTFVNGQLISNVTEPYFLPQEPFDWDRLIQEEWADDVDVDKTEAPAYLAVIDTKTPFSMAQFEEYDTILWLNADSVYVKQNNGEIKGTPYPKNEEPTIINKTTINSFIEDAWQEIQKTVVLGAVVLLLLGAFVFFLSYFIYLALATLLFFIVSQANGLKHEYPEAFRLTVYAMTPAWALSMVLGLLGFVANIQMPPFLFTGLVMLTLYFNLRQTQESTKK